MGKIITSIIKDFSGGITNDIRAEIANVVALSYHFNITDKKLVPKRAYTTLTDGGEKITRFIYTLESGGAAHYMYGLGQNATGKPKIFYSTLPATAWTALTDAVGTIGAVATNVFFLYKNILYFWQAGKLSTWAISSATLTESYQTIAYTNVAQPVHHPADDCAYFFQDNVVHRLNNVTWSSAVLTLPSNLKIIGGAPYGDYLAILCSPLDDNAGTTDSILYLWDRDSSLSTITAKINLGVGEAKHIGYDNNGVFITQTIKSISQLGSYNNSLMVKYYNGSLIEKKISDATSSAYFYDITLVGNPVSANNAFYFPVHLRTSKEGGTYDFIMKAQIINGQIILTANQNIASVTAGQTINGIYELTEFWFVAHSASTTLQTLITGTYTQESAIETILYSLGDSSVKKKLLGVTVMTPPLAGQIVLEYRKDEDTAWTTIFTHAVTNSISHSAINIESSGATLPEFKEIQFRIESTLGAEITGLKFKVEVLDKDIL